MHDDAETVLDKAAIERHQKLLIFAADIARAHLGDLRSAPPVGIEHLVPVTLFILTPQHLPRHQMMQTMLVEHRHAGCYERPLVDVLVMRIVAVMIEAKVE